MSSNTFLKEYIDKHAIPGVLTFGENEHGLAYASIGSAACKAVLFLQGAHLAEWQPVGQEPVLYLSERSAFAPGKAIRGGVPIIFPWFGARTANKYSSRTDGPSHGFVRTSEWQLADAKMDGTNVHLKLTLDPNDTTRALGFDAFHLTYELTIGAHLELELTVENRSSSTMLFEEALHTYLMVGDVRQASIHGLAGTDYIDKTDEFKRKHQTESALILSSATDRPYLDTEEAVEVMDPVLQRTLTTIKANSRTTVVWNPWIEQTARLADMNPEGWQSMVCIETANALDNAIVLPPGEKHTMRARLAVENQS